MVAPAVLIIVMPLAATPIPLVPVAMMEPELVTAAVEPDANIPSPPEPLDEIVPPVPFVMLAGPTLKMVMPVDEIAPVFDVVMEEPFSAPLLPPVMLPALLAVIEAAVMATPLFPVALIWPPVLLTIVAGPAPALTPAVAPLIVPVFAVRLRPPEPEMMPSAVPVTEPAFESVSRPPKPAEMPLAATPVPEIVAPELLVIFAVPLDTTIPFVPPVTVPLLVTVAEVPPLVMPALPPEIVPPVLFVTESAPLTVTTPAPLLPLTVPEFVKFTLAARMPALTPLICPVVPLVTVAVVAAEIPLSPRPVMLPVLLLTVTNELMVAMPF